MSQRFCHWKPRYIVNRIQLLIHERTHPDSPWLSQAMIEILGSWLQPQHQGLEWGSGRSTLWFAQRVNHLISIEHDESWYRRINSQLKETKLGNVDYRLCRNPREYVSCVEQLPREQLDFVLIDGIAATRDRCALAAVPILKVGGILIIDNCNWYLPNDSRAPDSRRAGQGAASHDWELFLQRVCTWRRIWTTNGVTDTALWVKSAE